MIFVTIGSAFPFDRLIEAMDDLTASSFAGEEVFAQIGRGRYRPKHMRWTEKLGERDFAATIAGADLVVSHAGMGTVISCLRTQTPAVLLPRRFEQGEHTTDHQIATAKWLEGRPGIFVAWSEDALETCISEARSHKPDIAALDAYAPREFTDRIRRRLNDWLGD